MVQVASLTIDETSSYGFSPIPVFQIRKQVHVLTNIELPQITMDLPCVRLSSEPEVLALVGELQLDLLSRSLSVQRHSSLVISSTSQL